MSQPVQRPLVGEGPAAVPPASVVTAYRLFLVSLGISVLAAALSPLVVADLVRASTADLAQQGAELDARFRELGLGGPTPGSSRGTGLGDAFTGLVEQQVRASMITLLVATLIGTAVALVVLQKMRAGRNWARILLTVFGGLSALGSVLRIGQLSALVGESGVGTVLLVLVLGQAAVLVAAIVPMFRGGAPRWFAVGGSPAA